MRLTKDTVQYGLRVRWIYGGEEGKLLGFNKVTYNGDLTGYVFLPVPGVDVLFDDSGKRSVPYDELEVIK